MPGPKAQHRPEYKEFIKRLRQARQEAGFRQVDVAAKLRKLQNWVSKVERGERRLDILELARFARLYKKPLEFFVPEDLPASFAPKRAQRKRTRGK